MNIPNHLKQFKGFENLWLARVLLFGAMAVCAYGATVNTANLPFLLLGVILGASGIAAWLIWGFQYAVKQIKQQSISKLIGYDRYCGLCGEDFLSDAIGLGYEKLQKHIDAVHGGNKKYGEDLLKKTYPATSESRSITEAKP